jgi:DNA-binding NarL/FixJ family response regulator
MTPISISLIEDDAQAAGMLTGLLDEAGGFRVASHHSKAEDALAELPNIKPEMALVDLVLPAMGGVECIRRLKRQLPGLLCLVITQYDDIDLLFDALQAGADGYVLKRASDRDIIEAIRTVIDGGGVMSPSICRKVLDYFQSIQPSRQAQSLLSTREIEILQLARRGQRAKQIAATIGISYETVRTHFRNIYRELHVHSLPEAVKKTFGK